MSKESYYGYEVQTKVASHVIYYKDEVHENGLVLYLMKIDNSKSAKMAVELGSWSSLIIVRKSFHPFYQSYIYIQTKSGFSIFLYLSFFSFNFFATLYREIKH